MLQLFPGGFLKEVVEDTSPVMGGDLDGGGFDISNVRKLTLGELVVNDKRLLINVAATGTRESIMRSFVSDAGNDTFGIGNGTAIVNRFTPVFYGFINSNNTEPALSFRSFVTAAKDASETTEIGLVSFVCIRTDSITDPVAGDYTAVQNRMLFTFGTIGSFDLLTIAAGGNIGMGTAAAKSKLEVAGAISSATVTITASSDVLDVSGVNTVFINISADIVLGGLVGGVNGQIVNFVFIGNFVNHCRFEHAEGIGGSTQDFINHVAVDEDIDHGGCIYVCNGTNWYDVSHAKHV